MSENQKEKLQGAPSQGEDLNVLGEPLQLCCMEPMTGFFRDGYCRTDAFDHGQHTICIIATAEFLAFSKGAGNDLSTPRLEFGFPGLKAGDCWCVCAERWREALESGVAPPVRLASCHESALDCVSLDDLKRHVLQ